MKRGILCTMMLVAGILLGCSGGKLSTEGVSGTVTLDGSPLAGASVTFYPKTAGQGVAAYATTDANGVYQLQTTQGNAGAGTTEGDYIVTVTKVESIDTGKKKKQNDGTELPVYERKIIAPEEYGKESTTPFSCVVKKGANTFDMELTSK